MNVIVLEDMQERIEWFNKHYPTSEIYSDVPVFISAMSNRMPWDIAFLDHDLGGTTYADVNSTKHGMEAVRWIEEHHPDVRRFIIHSCNYPAAVEMERRLQEAGYPVFRIPFHRLVELSIGSNK